MDQSLLISAIAGLFAALSAVAATYARSLQADKTLLTAKLEETQKRERDTFAEAMKTMGALVDTQHEQAELLDKLTEKVDAILAKK